MGTVRDTTANMPFRGGGPTRYLSGMGAVEFVSIALPAIFWPLVVVLFTWWQRDPIGRLIDRIRGGRAFGAEFDAPPPDLAEAVQGGASSPEVEELIRSASEEVKQAPSSGEESSRNEVLDSMARADVAASRSLLERLTLAQHQDEGRRRSEIERVMQSAARWGATMARSAPNDIDGWEPKVLWKANGEPAVVAVRRAEDNERRTMEERMAKRSHFDAIAAHVHARRIADAAREALLEDPDSRNSAFLREQVGSAEKREEQAWNEVQMTAEQWGTRQRGPKDDVKL